jgi:hypothetical protein
MEKENKKKFDIKKVVKEDPLKFALVIVAVITMLVAIYFGIQNYNLDKEKTELEKEKTELEKPIILAPGLRVTGGSSSVDFPFYVKNPSGKEYYIDLTQGCCLSDSALLTKSAPKQTESSKENVDVGENITISKTQPQTIFPVPPHEQVILHCSGFDVHNPVEDTIVNMRVCIKEKRMTEQICENLQITILKR